MLNRKTKKGITAFAGAMMIAGAVGTQMVSVSAAAPADGTTPVSYENRKVLPDDNGTYGMIIPTAIAFSDGKEEIKNVNVEITGINGFDLAKDWSHLEVKTTLSSANEFKLKFNNSSADYSLTYGNDKFDKDNNTTGGEITKHLGNLKGTLVEKVEGTANLTNKTNAVEKGQYKDTLIYVFEEVFNVRK